MADIRVNNEYVTIKRDGEVEICEFFKNARIETEQTIFHTTKLEDIKDAFPLPEDGRLSKNKIYLKEGQLLVSKEDIILKEDTDLGSEIFVSAIPLSDVLEINPIEITKEVITP